MKISFTLNGRQLCLEADPSRRLIDFLREDLGLTGTKEGCGEGECGSCTVIIDRGAVHALSLIHISLPISGESLSGPGNW